MDQYLPAVLGPHTAVAYTNGHNIWMRIGWTICANIAHPPGRQLRQTVLATFSKMIIIAPGAVSRSGTARWNNRIYLLKCVRTDVIDILARKSNIWNVCSKLALARYRAVRKRDCVGKWAAIAHERGSWLGWFEKIICNCQCDVEFFISHSHEWFHSLNIVKIKKRLWTNKRRSTNKIISQL